MAVVPAEVLHEDLAPIHTAAVAIMPPFGAWLIVIAALAAFADIVERAPTHSLADNAQYWIGESYYGLGRYRQALAAFTRVHAFDPTE